MNNRLSIILAIISIILSSFVIAMNIQAKCEPEEYAAEESNIQEVAATELAAMPEEEIESWHRFNEVYRESCPMCALDQLELFNACEEFNIDYFLMLGLIERETDFRNIIGDGGDSYGYCQVQPYWWWNTMHDIGALDLNEPQDNFRTACAILRQLFDKYGEGETVDVLTAYNSGHGGDSEYARAVIANQERWANE